MVMDGFEAYKYSHAVNLHFNSPSYDCFKYRFKTNVTQKSYWGRNDKYQLTKIGSRFKDEKEIIKYFACHQVAGNKWVGDMIRDEDTYTQFLKRIDSLSYLFRNELEDVSDMDLGTLLGNDGKLYPKIIDLYLEGTLSLETVCIMNRLTGFIEGANSKITETILWPDIYKKVIKYQQFLDFDRTKMKNLILKTFTQ